MKLFRKFSTISISLLGISGVVQALPLYSLTPLPTGFTPMSLSAGGVVAGYYFNGSADKAAYYDGAQHLIFNTITGHSYAASINASGTIVGSSIDNAFVYRNGKVQVLPHVGPYSYPNYARAINDNGIIAGSATGWGGSSDTFIYDGSMHILEGAGTPTAINASGVVVGNNVLKGSAFYYDGEMHVLSPLIGDDTVTATAINTSGVIVGTSTKGSQQSHAYVYDGAMRDLGSLGGYSRANGINDAGYIVGQSTLSIYNQGLWHAFVYDGSQMLDLNTLLVGSNIAGIELVDAIGISDRKQIIAIDVNRNGYLLTYAGDGPLQAPVPAAAWLFGSALVGLAAAARRKAA